MAVQSQDRKTDAVAVSVEGLGKTFGGKVAFADVSFEIGHGEVFGFLGANGAGKTTTVRTLGTLIAPTSGSAVVAGLPLTPANGARIRSRIAIVPESPGLYQRLSVRENLECFADLYGTPARRERITRALTAVNLADRADDVSGALSKGCGSGSRWPGRCWPTRSCCSSTSPQPDSTRSRPRRCSRSSRACGATA